MVKVAKVRPRFYGRMEVVLDAGTNSLILMPYALLSEIDSFHLNGPLKDLFYEKEIIN